MFRKYRWTRKRQENKARQHNENILSAQSKKRAAEHGRAGQGRAAHAGGGALFVSGAAARRTKQSNTARHGSGRQCAAVHGSYWAVQHRLGL